MSKYKHLIWSNTDLNYEDWRADLESEYPELSEDERMERMYEINADYLDDERMNLNITLGMPILIIADLGLWDGRHSGYRRLRAGTSKTAWILMRTLPHGMLTTLAICVVTLTTMMDPITIFIACIKMVSAKPRWIISKIKSIAV